MDGDITGTGPAPSSPDGEAEAQPSPCHLPQLLLITCVSTAQELLPCRRSQARPALRRTERGEFFTTVAGACRIIKRQDLSDPTGQLSTVEQIKKCFLPKESAAAAPPSAESISQLS